MIKAMAWVAILVLGIAEGLPAQAGSIPCTCRDTTGADVPEGGTSCIRSPEGPQLARCEKVLNNTSWKLLGLPCPQSSVRQPVRSGKSALL